MFDRERIDDKDPTIEEEHNDKQWPAHCSCYKRAHRQQAAEPGALSES